LGVTDLEASGGFDAFGGVSIDPTKTKVRKKNKNLRKGLGMGLALSVTCQ